MVITLELGQQLLEPMTLVYLPYHRKAVFMGFDRTSPYNSGESFMNPMLQPQKRRARVTEQMGGRKRCQFPGRG
jgi:hypothetical protein